MPESLLSVAVQNRKTPRAKMSRQEVETEINRVDELLGQTDFQHIGDLARRVILDSLRKYRNRLAKAR